MRLHAHHLDIGGALGFVQEVVPERPNGTTLLAIHTAGQTGVQWRHTLADFADLGYRVLVPDLPGHGHSEPAVDGAVTDLADYATWLVEVLDRLADGPTIVVGCSIGGKVAQELAVRHGDLLGGAVSMCAEPGPGRGKIHALRRELEDSAAPARSDRTHLGTRAVVGRATPSDRAALIARMHCREDPLVSNSDLIGWCTHDVREELADVTCPMTFVAGEDDLWVDPVAVEWAAAQVPDADYVFLEGYGHYPMEEMDGFAGLLDSWITKMRKGR
ncbi:alpha/beta fold hydrolase [Nocardioides pakistanensis]